MRTLLSTAVLLLVLAVMLTTTTALVMAAWWAGAGAFAWLPVVVSAILIRHLYATVLGGIERTPNV